MQVDSGNSKFQFRDSDNHEGAFTIQTSSKLKFNSECTYIYVICRLLFTCGVSILYNLFQSSENVFSNLPMLLIYLTN